MITPEKCPKCGAALKGGFLDVYNCDSAFEEDDDGWFLAQSYHCVATQRDQLAERVKRLEEAGDAMAMAEGCRCDDGIICKRCFKRADAWRAAKGQP